MKTKEYSWSCPLCPDDPAIVRGSVDFLQIAIANHIRIAHEERIAMLSVDKARLQCPYPNCEIGRKNHINKSIGNTELALTDFDKNWLTAMKISTE